MNLQNPSPKTIDKAETKRWWLTLLIFGFFAVLALSYFTPALTEGKDLYQPDVAGASGTAQDVRDFAAQTGETSYWTNSLFGGMPMYQIAPAYPSTSILKKVQDLITLQWPLNLLPSYSWLLFAMLGGFFLFMRALGVRRLPSAIGAILWAFSTYFIILIPAGHIWKLMVLAFIPPTIAGIIHIYKGRYLLGGVMTTFFATLQIMSNHVQMSYYFAFLIVFIILGYLVDALQRGELRSFVYATLVLIGSALLSIGMNSSNLYHTYQYSQETIRSGSELTPIGQVSSTQTKGVDKDYITAWSYGLGETWSLLVPNVRGGASDYIGNSPELMEQVEPQYANYVGQMSQYFGAQPFTSGPVYAGAFVCFLFLLGCFIVRTPFRWALVAGTILSILLSWGHNMMWLTDLFIDYFPMYNKFRTVSSILVIAEFTIPTLAILALITFIQDPKAVLRNRLALGVSAGFTLGMALLFALTPTTLINFISPQEQEMFRQAATNPMAMGVMHALSVLRAGMVSADAWRSVFVILLSLGVCYLYAIDKLKRTPTLILIGLISLIDLWTVNRRYLNDEMFVDQSQIEAQGRPTTPFDKEINQDTDPHYRVLNLGVANPFSDATTSFHHRSVGGYHPAKLSRYQDLIERQIGKGNRAVLNMLDTRYVVQPNEQGQLALHRNEDSFGPAWFPSEVVWVNSPDEEMMAMDSLDLRNTVVMNRRDANEQEVQASVGADSLSSIGLKTYAPNQIEYTVKTNSPRLVVFSEIYYPHGWHLTMENGQELPILRANYTLRATIVPAGEHQLTMRFDPQSIHMTERIAWVAQLLLALGVIALICVSLRRRNKSNLCASND